MRIRRGIDVLPCSRVRGQLKSTRATSRQATLFPWTRPNLTGVGYDHDSPCPSDRPTVVEPSLTYPPHLHLSITENGIDREPEPDTTTGHPPPAAAACATSVVSLRSRHFAESSRQSERVAKLRERVQVPATGMAARARGRGGAGGGAVGNFARFSRSLSDSMVGSCAPLFFTACST